MQSHTQHFELVELCKAGDRRAQFQLYQAYSKAMFNVCLRMMGDREAAEDVLQNAFVDIFGKLDSFRFEASVGSWIKRIVINQCINSLKKRKMHFVEFSSVQIPDQSSDPVVDQLEVERIKEAMKDLPDGYRTVFNLYLMEGYDHKEIGKILGISEGASKSQYSRAKAKLRELLSDKSNVC